MNSSEENELSRVQLFAGLTDEELATLTEAKQVRRYPKNTTIINEGDTTDALYLISSGKVKVVRTLDGGKEVVISVLGPGDYFGEMSLIDHEPRSASVVTREDSEIIMLYREMFTRLLLANPQLAVNIMKGLCQRLRDADQRIESLALMDVYGRIAGLLIQMSEEQDGLQVIRDELTHQDIASMVGASREMVSRILKDLTRGGYITIEKKIITINTKLPASW